MLERRRGGGERRFGAASQAFFCSFLFAPVFATTFITDGDKRANDARWIDELKRAQVCARAPSKQNTGGGLRARRGVGRQARATFERRFDALLWPPSCSFSGSVANSILTIARVSLRARQRDAAATAVATAVELWREWRAPPPTSN